MRAGRTTNLASIIPLLGAFVVAAIVIGVLGAGLVMPAVAAVGAATRTGVDMFDALPSEFTAAALSQQSKIVDAKGNVIATPHDENRIVVPLDQVSPVMQKAQVAIEDSRFYEHGGVDPRGVVRALVSNASGSVNTSGGSTLTQQYVKLTLLDTALKAGDTQAAQAAVTQKGLAGVTRKLQELKYSIQLEKEESKDQILQGYLNIVYYGDQAYGVEAASLHYFNKHAKDLNLTEAAMLAGLAQNPGTTDPVHNPDKALARRNVVLDRMHELGLISDKETADAKAVTLDQMLHVTQAPTACQQAGDSAYFCDYVLKWLELDPSLDQSLGKTVEERKAKIFGGGLTIQTTLDPDLAAFSKQQLLAKVPQGNDVNGRHIGASSVTLDPNTGAVKAFAQNTTYSIDNKSWDQTSINWAVDKQYGGSAGFGFGSTEKAFALVTALEKGLPINTTVNAQVAGPGRTVDFTHSDLPDACGVARGTTWPVKNDGLEGGTMSLTQATADSVNTAFVALAQMVGVCPIQETETRMGLHLADGSPIPKDSVSSILLGAREVSPMTVASAYGSLANEGVHCSPVPIQAITGPDGKELPIMKPGTTNCQAVTKPEVANGVAQIMTSVLTDGTAKASALDGGRIAAGKTGTTNGNRQTWFVGYTQQLTTAVWVGQPVDQSQTLDNVRLANSFYPTVFGASIAAPLWKSIMDHALAGQPNSGFAAPSDTVLNGNKVDVPNVVGQSIDNATSALQAAGFTVTVGRRVYSNYRPGVVSGTSPSGQANQGGQVTLLVSAGPQPQPQQVQQPQQPQQPQQQQPSQPQQQTTQPQQQQDQPQQQPQQPQQQPQQTQQPQPQVPTSAGPPKT